MTTAPSQDPFTLTRFILQEQQKYANAKGDLSIILNNICISIKIIASAAKGAGIYSLYGLQGNDTQNKSGDFVKKLDIFSNNCMINTLKWSGKIAIMCSEENEDPIILDSEEPKYAVVFDPLDGSSNIDANVSVGTIFGILRVHESKAHNSDVHDLLQAGSELVCAGYAMYGDATLFVLSFGDSVQGFTLDPQIGEFILTHRNIKIPEKGNIYSCNTGNLLTWDPVMQQYIKKCQERQYKGRYIGSMVADVHRTLLYGGIFMYPANKSAPNGKLRLLYECNPMAFILEAAGGKASTGYERILDIIPDKIHCRRPIILGSKLDVEELEKMYQTYGNYKKKENEKKGDKKTAVDILNELEVGFKGAEEKKEDV